MSFILDALRKSEHQRQRQAGPGLAEVAVARPVARGNPWAAIAIGVLVLNVLVLGAWLLRKALRDTDDAPPPAIAQGPATPTTTMTQTVPYAPPRAAPATRPPPPVLQPALEGPPPDAAGANPLADEVGEALAGIADPAHAAAPLARAPSTGGTGAGGTVVYETQPMNDDTRLAMPPASGTAERSGSAASQLPTAEEVSAQAGLPALNLDIHVFGNQAKDRFVFINGRKYVEGDALQEGPQVEQIHADGVVLSYRGNRFMLPRP